jgi:monovalent cation:proton antiporter-2 (CPA2) family protein
MFKRLGLGSVLGYLIAGVVIGPYALGLISDPERVLHFAEFGVVMLLFLVGLELEPKAVWRLRKSLLGLGGIQVLGTIAAIMALGAFTTYTWQTFLIIGIGFAMSSTAIGITSLKERQLLKSEGGQASFAVLLFQDLSVIPLFMLLALIAPHSGASSSNNLVDTLKAILIIAAIVLASRTVIKPIMRAVANTGMREVFVAFSLLLVIGVSVAVQSVGLSMALGTFLAGVLLANSEYRYELQLDIEPVKGLLLGLFFIAVGMSVDLNLIMQQPLLIATYSASVVALKAIILFILARGFSLTKQSSGLISVGLSQVGEFAFVIFSTALAQGSLTKETYNILNAVVAISMLATPLLFVIYDAMCKAPQNNAKEDDITEQHPIIIAGFGRFGQIIARILHAGGFESTLIDHDPKQVDLMRSFGWRCYYGDASRVDLLEQAGIEHARLFVIAIDEAESAIETAKIVRQRWPHVPIVARARSRTEAFDLLDLGLSPIRETFHSALNAAQQSLEKLGLTPHAAWRGIQQFERHDQEQLKRTAAIRHDQQAVLSLVEQGRVDLEQLLSEELSSHTYANGRTHEVWSHATPPDGN